MSLSNIFNQSADPSRNEPDVGEFFDAVKQGRMAAVTGTVLRDRKALAWTGSDGECAIHLAAENGRNEMIDFFLAEGDDIDRPMNDDEEISPLIQALCMNQEGTALHLIDKGARVTMHDGLSPLVYAAGLRRG